MIEMTLFKPESNLSIGTQDMPYIGVCQFGNHTIRVFGTNNNPMFPLRDVCNATGQRTDAATNSLETEFGKGVQLLWIPLQTVGGMQDHILINEDEFYHLAGTGRTEFSKAFRAFVREVMKQIRLVGSYQLTPPKTSAELILEVMTILTKQVEEERKLKEEAIRTKALIGSKREATAMAAASHATQQAKRLQAVNAGLTAENEDLKTRLDESESYMTLLGYCRLRGLDTSYANSPNGKALSKICRAKNIEIKKAAHGTYGEVSSYPVSELDLFFNKKIM